MWDAVGGLPVGSAPAFVAGGVGNIGTVLRIDEKKVVAVHSRPWDPQANGGLGAEIDLFLSTVPYMSFPTDTPASTRFEAVLERGYEFNTSLFAGDEIGARSLPSLGNGIVDNRDDNRDFYQRLNFAGRDWRVFVGDQFDQFASFFEVWPGKSGAVDLERDRIIVPLEDIGKRFDQPMQTDLYNPGFEPYVVLDGSNDFIDFGDNLDRATGNFRMGVSFRTSSNQSAGLYTKKSTAGGGIDAGYALILTTGGALQCVIADGVAIDFAAASVTYNDGKRHTAVGDVRRSSNLIDLYFDGVLVSSQPITVTGGLQNAVNLYAGRLGNGTLLFTGEIERVAQNAGGASIADFQSALDERFADDVDASGLDHYVPLTENVGTSAGDISPSGVNGTLTGGALWSGTTNGTQELVDVIKPQAFGQPFHTEPDLIDGTKLVYRLHDGSIDAVVQVFDGGVELFEDPNATGDIFTGPGPGGAVADDWMADLPRGLIRLANPPAARLTITLRGDNSPDYTEEPSEILRRIANRKLGIPDPQGFDEQAFEDFILEATGPGIDLFPDPRAVSLFDSQHNLKTFAQAFDLLMRPRGWWAIGRTGLVTVGKLRHFSLPDSDIDDDDIVAGTLKRVAVPPVHWRDRTTYQRYWTVQTGGELLPAVTPRRRSLLSQEFRFVTDEDESLRVAFLDAIDATVETAIWIKSDALKELADLRDLYGVKTEAWEVKLATGVLQYWLGDAIRFKTQRYNLFERVFYVVGIAEEVNTGVRLTLWGKAE